MGYHRLFTHHSFKTYKIVEYFLAICGSLNWQGGLITWVGTHRLHHRDSDMPGDPHSPVVDGFNWAHIFWALYSDPPDFHPRDAAKDLQRDPVLVLIDRYFYLFMIPLAVGLYMLGGWPCVIWGVCVRTALGYHFTWFVNSASHLWGYRNFKTTDASRNNWWVALVSWGEGWHNNHHAQQRSAAHGMRWWEFDVTYQVIRVMSWLHLSHSIVRPDKSTMISRRRKAVLAAMKARREAAEATAAAVSAVKVRGEGKPWSRSTSQKRQRLPWPRSCPLPGR